MFWKYYLASRLFGITFSVRLMERNEATAQENYRRLKGEIPEVDAILKEEHDHEERLVGFFDEEHLRYAGSIVLGLNDALVEMLGALAGLTLALQNSSLIALSALTTGIAAAMSMGASEYLSTKTEENSKHPLKSSFYTGFTYLFIVAILVAPYLLLENYYLSFGITLLLAVTAMGLFNYYMAVAKDLPFLKRFGEMAGLSLGVALHNFPEGMAIAGGGAADVDVSLVIALAIAIHCIPEGICTAASVFYTTGRRFKSFLMTGIVFVILLGLL